MVRNWIEELSKYADDHTSSEGDLLRELERKTYLSALSPQMLSGKLQGRLLSMLSKLVQPIFVLDIGTFTGYSCISLLDGFGEEGLMYTIDVNVNCEDSLIFKFNSLGIVTVIPPLLLIITSCWNIQSF